MKSADTPLRHLADTEGVLVVDETGFVKKGTHSVGVARQYSGTAGRIENSQVGVFLAYASRFGQALIDRQLYLPEAWAGDAERRAGGQYSRAHWLCDQDHDRARHDRHGARHGHACAWVLADALYGSDSKLRRMLEARDQPYVLAVRSNHCLRIVVEGALMQTDPEAMANDLAPGDWSTHAAGEGAKGLRLYDWARIPLGKRTDPRWEHWVLVRRNQRDPSKRAYYFVFAPAGTTLAELAGVAGLRWTIEECFQRAKDDLGLDHCEAAPGMAGTAI
jgi:SRSO17 transposase